MFPRVFPTALEFVNSKRRMFLLTVSVKVRATHTHTTDPKAEGREYLLLCSSHYCVCAPSLGPLSNPASCRQLGWGPLRRCWRVFARVARTSGAPDRPVRWLWPSEERGRRWIDLLEACQSSSVHVVSANAEVIRVGAECAHSEHSQLLSNIN